MHNGEYSGSGRLCMRSFALCHAEKVLVSLYGTVSCWICALKAPGSKAGTAVHEQDTVTEPKGAVGKKSLLLPSGVVLLQALMLFTLFSKSPRARFHAVQLSLKSKCTFLALLAFLTCWKIRFLNVKEPAGKHPLPEARCPCIPLQSLAWWRRAFVRLGSSILNICPNSPRLVQAVSEIHKAWPENVLFDKIDLGGSELFYLIALSLFAWASSVVLWNAGPSLLVEPATNK